MSDISKEMHPVFHIIKEHAHRKVITLVYAAKDEIHNNAVALRAYLENAWHNIPL